MRYFIFCVVLLSAVGVPASRAQPRGGFTVSETGAVYFRLDDAVAAIGAGSGTIVIAPGRYSDCAVFAGTSLSLKAAAPSTAILDSGSCEGKATLVLKGMRATVDGVVFENVRVPDRNGAGIRLEHGDLDVVRSTFQASEQGILTGDDAAGTVTITASTFSGLGGCPGGMCSHSIYIGDYGRLIVTRSRFEAGSGGHYIKSRSPHVTVTDSSFDDAHGHATNYMIDLPNGAVGSITDNVFVVGHDKENHSAIIAVAAERRQNPSAGLVIERNIASLAPGVGFATTFVADWSHEPLRIGANTLGAGITRTDVR